MMTNLDIAKRRLHNHHLAGAPFEKPEEVVRWLGAVQAQDYFGAKWGIAQRTRDAADAAIDQLFADGTILRTHLMRPTWHFVLPADIRWLLALTGPRVHAVNAYYYRKFELDDDLFGQSNALLAGALQGGKQLTRAELAKVLQDGGIAASGLRLAYVLMRAELDAVICSGARRGKQFTYALLDERAPHAKTLERDEALAELATRYFRSRGPATVRDFAGWSGLTMADARSGLEMVKSQLTHEDVDGQTYWFETATPPVKDPSPTAYLLPNYDEYISGYKDWSPVLEAALLNGPSAKEDALAGHVIAMNGLIVGGWRRTLQRNEVTIETTPLVALSSAEKAALKVAAEGYGRFLGLSVRFGNGSPFDPTGRV